MSRIEIRNVSYCYGEKGKCFRALDGVNLTIEDGEFISVIGRSGCGKSTLLRLLAGLAMPTEGEILVDGEVLTGPSTQIAIVFQNYTLFPWMKVLDNVVFAIRQADKTISKEAAEETAMEMLERVEMAEAWNKYPYQLSGGMKQRVAIAKALAMDTEILLLDEPFGALDSKTRRALRKLLERLWMESEERKTVIMVTHDVPEAVKMGDRIVFMTPGKVAHVLDSDLPRPRCGIDTRYTCDLQDLEKELVSLFYRSEAGLDEEDVTDEE